MNVLCTICARSGSKGLKNKNIRKINGIPLISYSINQAFKSRLFNKIVVSTDSITIKNIVSKQMVDHCFIRNKKLSGDKISKISVIKDLLIKSENKYNKNFDIIVDLDVTSPLRKVSDIKKSFKDFLNNGSTNMVTVTKASKNPYFNMIEYKNGSYQKVKKFKNKKFTTRQSTPKVYNMNASIYLWKRKTILQDLPIINSKTSIYEMPKIRSTDIDDIEDFNYVKYLMNKK